MSYRGQFRRGSIPLKIRDLFASVDIAESTVSLLMKAQPPQKDSSTNTNINQLLFLTGFELVKLGDQFEAKYGCESDISIAGDVTKLLAMNTKAPSNEGVAFELASLGFGGEVKSVVGPSVGEVKVDKTDWANVMGNI